MSRPIPIRTTLIAAGALIALAAALLFPQLNGGSANAAKTVIANNSSILSQANETPRLTVLCPKGKAHKFPYGGGMFSAPYGPDGEGVYPHSYERLGVQHGYHVTPVMFDPAPPLTAPRTVTLQVVCGPEPGKLTPPHQTAQVSPGTSKTHTIPCPGKRKLIGGGFQRTNFVGPQQGAPTGGNYVTESRMIAPKVWQVSGTAIGTFGGELTGIAYCRRGGGLTPVSATTTVNPGQSASATTPPCTGGRLVFSGFNTEPKGSMFYAGGSFNLDQSTTGTAYNRSLAPGTFTVDGYCLGIKK